jgi:hypothetical protein
MDIFINMYWFVRDKFMYIYDFRFKKQIYEADIQGVYSNTPWFWIFLKK